MVIGAAVIIGGTASSLAPPCSLGRQAIPNARRVARPRQNLGHASAGASVSARILTPNGGMAGSAVRAGRLYSNARFLHFLKPGHYFQRFGCRWLVSGVSLASGAGLRVTQVEQHNRYVEVSNVAAAEAALSRSPLPARRPDGQAPTGALGAPAGVAASIHPVSRWTLRQSSVRRHRSLRRPDGFGRLPARRTTASSLPTCRIRQIPCAVQLRQLAVRSAYEDRRR
jgi:hypothetical protein